MIRPTIYEVIRAKLGREPTHAELTAEVLRIIREATDARLTQRRMARQN